MTAQPSPRMHELTLAELLAPGGGEPFVYGAEEARGYAFVFRICRAAVREAEDRLRPLAAPCGVDGYLIAAEGPDWTDGVVAVYEAATGRCVGGQGRGVPVVDEGHHGRGLGAEIQWFAWESGIGKPSGNFSPAGLASRRQAHRIAVERALAAGAEVRAEVLADYPDLARPGRTPG